MGHEVGWAWGWEPIGLQTDARLRTGQVQRTYKHEGTMVNDVVIHPNQGELISCDQLGSVKIWDLGENTCTHELVPAEDVPIRSVSIASDGGTLVAGNNLGTVFVWRIQGGADSTNLVPVTSFVAHNKYVTRCLLSPDTRHLATCSADTTVKLWSTKDYEYTLERTLEGHQRWVWDAAFSADSAYLVTASSDHAARLWDLATVSRDGRRGVVLADALPRERQLGDMRAITVLQSLLVSQAFFVGRGQVLT